MKRIKDPIYGYIEIDDDAVKIIDTASFQRLRNIVQTSYVSLYPASHHNRFIHSLGVYHLGKKAIRTLLRSFKCKPYGFTDDELNKYVRLFEFACLLHDVGHAPFSHTGENFYFQANSNLKELLCDCVKDKAFEETVFAKNSIVKQAAAHEMMSAIVAINTFPRIFRNKKDKEFFARCITGYLYNSVDKKYKILDCIIQLLNSSIIDMDRLDYVIRDAQTIGFNNVAIDIERLISGICIIERDNNILLGYDKSALSVIENVIFAHDSEKKWIQNHPTILYEHNILQHGMRCINRDYSKLFTYQALTQEGIAVEIKRELDGTIVNDNRHIALVADNDITYIMKYDYSDDLLIGEYFSREKRRHPIWKSEAEYRALFDSDLGEEKLALLESSFSSLEKFIEDLHVFPCPIINNETLALVEQQEKEFKEKEKLGLISDKDSKLVSNHLKWIRLLQNIANENGIPFNFVIVTANKFQSGFIKPDLDKLYIDFPNLGLSRPIKKVSTILTASKDREQFFYLFCYAKEGVKLNRVKIADMIKAELFTTD